MKKILTETEITDFLNAYAVLNIEFERLPSFVVTGYRVWFLY